MEKMIVKINVLKIIIVTEFIVIQNKIMINAKLNDFLLIIMFMP